MTGVPQPLDEAEKQAMVLWLCPLTRQFPAPVDLVLAAAPKTLDHYVFHRLHQSGVAESNGPEVARLLRGVMATLDTVLYDGGEVLELVTIALNNGAAPSDVLAVADDMMRLGCAGAEHLRRLAGGGAE